MRPCSLCDGSCRGCEFAADGSAERVRRGRRAPGGTRRNGRRGEARRSRVDAATARRGRRQPTRSVAGRSSSVDRPKSVCGHGVADGVAGRADASMRVARRAAARRGVWCLHVRRFRTRTGWSVNGRMVGGSENVAFDTSPGTGTYAHADNVVKSDRRTPGQVRLHGNSQISGVTRVVALPRPRRSPTGLQIDLRIVYRCRRLLEWRLRFSPNRQLRRRTAGSDGRLRRQVRRGRRCANHDGGS